MNRSNSNIPPSVRRHYRLCRMVPLMGDMRRRVTRRAIIKVVSKILLIKIQDGGVALLETVSTKIHWLLVFPAARAVSYIYNTPCFKHHLRVHIALSQKISRLGKPFREFAFFLKKRRHLLAHREDILAQRLYVLAKLYQKCRTVSVTFSEIDRSASDVKSFVKTSEQDFHGRSSKGGLGLGRTSQSTAECNARLFQRGRV